MSVNINETLDRMVREKGISYMEAILKYTNDVDCEIEMVAKMINKQIKDKIAWKVAVTIAKAMLEQPGVYFKRYGERWKVNDFLNGATHYHRNDVDPYWNRKMLVAATIGDHIFYVDPYR